MESQHAFSFYSVPFIPMWVLFPQKQNCVKDKTKKSRSGIVWVRCHGKKKSSAIVAGGSLESHRCVARLEPPLSPHMKRIWLRPVRAQEFVAAQKSQKAETPTRLVDTTTKTQLSTVANFPVCDCKSLFQGVSTASAVWVTSCHTTCTDDSPLWSSLAWSFSKVAKWPHAPGVSFMPPRNLVIYSLS